MSQKLYLQVHENMKIKLALLITLSWPLFVVAESNFELGKPVIVDKHAVYDMRVLANASYIDERGRVMLDVLEGSENFLALLVETNDGKPIAGLEPKFSIEGSSVIMSSSAAAPLQGTDESGIMEFGVLAGVKGLDRLNISYSNNSIDLHFNIISLDISQFPSLPELETDLSWDDLMSAQLDYQEEKLVASFTSKVMQQDGEKVDVAGFMLPLDTDTKQRHFLLVSAPPSCFYHFPGGPAGVIEVFSKEGVEATWSPVKLSGRLKLVESSKTGIIYQLEETELID
jgi:hypothetical protein